MKPQSKNRLWVLITAVLLLANIGLLAYIVWGRQPAKKMQERGKFMAAFLKNDLGFTDEQMKKFDSLRNSHRENSKSMFDEFRAAKSKNLRELGEAGFSDSAIIRTASLTAQQQQLLEVQMLTNLKSIRELCTAEQRIKFDTGYYKVMTRGKEKKKNNER